MCEYATYSYNGLLMCKPKNNMCTLCVFGNQKTYKEIKNENGEKEWQD